MKLQEIVAEVVETTNRPDKEDTIMRAVRAAVTETHGSARFPRDRVEEIFELSEPQHLIKLTLPPRFKLFEGLGAVSDTGAPIRLTTNNNQYTRVDPAGIFTTEFQYTQDVYYLAGAAFNIRSSVAVPNVFAIYYRFPEVADTQLETWIMEDQPSLVTDLALSKVYGAFGREKLAAEARGRWLLALESLHMMTIVEGDN
jgi:hypothetical protein